MTGNFFKKENSANLLWIPITGFVILMLYSLQSGLLDFFFSAGAPARNVLGIDFFCIPKAFLNLLEGRSMYDTWGGTPYGPYSTFFSYHPAFPVFFGFYFSFFSPWVSFWLFSIVNILICGYCAYLLTGLCSDIFEKRMMFVFFLCSFLTYWMIHVGNVHVVSLLSTTLIFAGVYELLNLKQGISPINKKIMTGILISLFSKPVVVLMIPLLLIIKETRKATVNSLLIYTGVSLVFLFAPTLNPESIGFGKMMEVAMNPEFIKRHLNIYTNNMVINDIMKDNSIHWFHIIAQSDFYWNHVGIFSFSAFLNSALSTIIPPLVYKIPLIFLLLCSFAILMVKDKKHRIEISMLILLATDFAYFLSYTSIWEYQYTSLFPAFAIIFLMYRRKQLPSWSLLILFLAVFYYLPSPFFMIKGSPVLVTNINWVRSTKVIPALICFFILAIWLWKKLKPAAREWYFNMIKDAD